MSEAISQVATDFSACVGCLAYWFYVYPPWMSVFNDFTVYWKWDVWQCIFTTELTGNEVCDSVIVSNTEYDLSHLHL